VKGTERVTQQRAQQLLGGHLVRLRVRARVRAGVRVRAKARVRARARIRIRDRVRTRVRSCCAEATTGTSLSSWYPSMTVSAPG
jgi:hypothetical protein